MQPAKSLERTYQRDLAVPRVSKSEFVAFHARYVAQRQPVIITDLFKGQAVETLADPDQVRQKIGSTQVNITRNYVQHSLDFMKSMLAGRPGGPAISMRSSTIQDYLELVREQPSTPWILTECPAPPDIPAMVDLRCLGISNILCGYPDPGEPRNSSAYSLLFIANPGNASDLHTDWDGRDVVLYQVFGRKRVTLFPPEAAPRLLPVIVFGTIRLNGMEPKTREEFVRFAGGWDDVLQPGEAVYMPAFYWHHFEYIDVALSFNFRHHGLVNPDAVYLMKYAHRDMYLQNLLAATLQEDKSSLVEPHLRSLREFVEQSSLPARQKFREATARVRKAFQQV